MARRRASDDQDKFDALDRQILQALSLSANPLNIQKIRQDFTLSFADTTARLKRLQDAGHVVQARENYFTAAEPAVGIMVVKVTYTGRKVLADGKLGHVNSKPRAVPVNWPPHLETPVITLPKHVKRLEMGERLLVRLTSPHNHHGQEMAAKVLKRLGFDQPATLVGKFRMASSGVATKSKVDIAFDGTRHGFRVSGVADKALLTDGMTVAVHIDETASQFRPKVIVSDLLWAADDDPKPLGMLTRLELGLKDYPAKVEKRVMRASRKPSLTKRTDLRHLPFMTIDGAYAKDFDDAIAVVPDTDPENKDGLVAYVAIADVAHFVQAHSEVDREARKRGFSLYFPDQAIHMLPKNLAENLCSLVPNQDRFALTLEIPYRPDGTIIYERCKPHRAVIRSQARLTYEQADSALANVEPLENEELQDALLRAGDLYYAIAGRKSANPRLDLLDEKIVAKFSGRNIIGFERLQRNTAAALIEDMMVDSGHVAARLLHDRDAPVISRLHEQPTGHQMQDMTEKLTRIGFPVPPEGLWTAGQITQTLAAHEDDHMQYQGQMAVLTSLTAAQYAVNKRGHFGLQMEDYAHFTSPIRRYADLMVHRALIEAYDLGPEKLDMTHTQQMLVCDQLNDLEAQAKRMTANCWKRYELAYLSRDVGNKIPAFIMKISRDKVHLRLNGSPFIRSYPADIFRENGFTVDTAKQVLVRKEDQARFFAGDVVDVRLDRSAPVVNDLSFTPLSSEGASKTAHPKRYGKATFVKVRSTPVKRSRLEATIASIDTKNIAIRIGDTPNLHSFPTQAFLGGAVQQRGGAIYCYNRKSYFAVGDTLPLVAETWRDMSLKKETNRYVWNVKTRYTLAQGPSSKAIPAAQPGPPAQPEVKLQLDFARSIAGGADTMQATLQGKTGLISVDTPIGKMSIQIAPDDINVPEGMSLSQFWQPGKLVAIRHAGPDMEGQPGTKLDFSYAATMRKPKAANDSAADTAAAAPNIATPTKDFA